MLDIVNINARDLPEAWFQCVYKLFEHGHQYLVDRGSFEGQHRLEFDYVTVHIQFPGSRPMVPDVPPGVPPPSTMEYVEGYLPYLMSNKPKPGEQYTYGQFLESQIDEVIGRLKVSPGTNQTYMAVGGIIHQGGELNLTGPDLFLADPPCLRGIDVRLLNGRLHFMVYFRSWDLWAGFPSNLAAVQLLKEYMASEIGVEDGELVAASKGLHLYEQTWEIARTAVRR